MKGRSVGLDFVCFGGEDWWYHNRGHIDMQLMKRFAGQGNVLYINSIMMQKPKLSHGKKLFAKIIRKGKSMMRSCKKTTAGFWAYSPMSLPVHHVGWLRKLNNYALKHQIEAAQKKIKINFPVIWVACPTACETALNLNRTALVYQKTDKYDEFPNVDSLLISNYDKKLMREADLTIFVNEALYNEQKTLCKNSLYLDHGVDNEMFANAFKSGYIPNDIWGVEKPIAGFFGGIDDHTFDYHFMLEVIKLLPSVSFVFVGGASFDCGEMLKMANVRMTGCKNYEEIPHYGKCFDVAIMPWRQNKWIANCNPIKLKEYLALGKPVVSTPFTELSKYTDVVYQADSPTKFAQAILDAYANDSELLVKARRAKVVSASWEQKASVVLNKLDECCNGAVSLINN